ncbi:hypothetical protein C8Q76DRAFT_858336 [Earliella scabrosa]|nr:hypothetical protein C8Q76DRAFT_858336 [Earliella scabrosa]
MLSPSPLRRQALPIPGPVDQDDGFQSPLRAYSLYSPQPPPDSSITIHDDDDLFLRPSPFSSSHFIPPSSPALRTPLRTPIKDPARDALQFSPDRSTLSVKHLNVTATLFSAASAGTKRKPTPICTTPSRTCTMTPLNVTSALAHSQGDSFSLTASPLSLPPLQLPIRDLDQSGDESGYDSDPDANGTIEKQPLLFAGGSGTSAAPFSSIKARSRTKASAKGKPPSLEVLTRKGLVNDEEVAEAISPGGHIIKGRARSHPVSAESLKSVQSTPVVSHKQVTATPRINEGNSASTVAFPSTRTMRTRTTSNSSVTSSESGSPRPNASGTTRTRTQSHTGRTLNRLESSSSATLFFGPSIHNSSSAKKSSKGSRTASVTNTPVSPLFLRSEPPSARPSFINRHSYAGGCADPGASSAWASRSPAAAPSSPAPVNARKRMESDSSEDEADIFFSSGPADSSFAISLQKGGTPSPKKKQKRESLDPLPKKVRPPDSGVVLSDSDGELDLPLNEGKNFMMAAMPRASTSPGTPPFPIPSLAPLSSLAPMAYHPPQAVLEAIRVLLSYYVDTPTLLLKCRGIHADVSAIVRDELRRRHSVFFRTIVNDTTSFFEVMRTCGAILAGGAAFAFLTDTPSLFAWPFYVDEDHFDAFKEHLIQREGFEKQGDEMLNINYNPNYCEVEPGTTLAGVRRLVVLEKGDVVVTVSSSGSPLFPPCSSVPIAFQHLTFFFNYLAADGLCCAYPSLTLHQRSLFALDQMRGERFLNMLAQYADRNLHFRTHPDNWDLDAAGSPRPCVRSWLAPCVKRSFGDRGCLTMILHDYHYPVYIPEDALTRSLYYELLCIHAPSTPPARGHLAGSLVRPAPPTRLMPPSRPSRPRTSISSSPSTSDTPDTPESSISSSSL